MMLIIYIDINFLNTTIMNSHIWKNNKNNTNKYVIRCRTNTRTESDTDGRRMSRRQVVFLNYT